MRPAGLPTPRPSPAPTPSNSPPAKLPISGARRPRGAVPAHAQSHLWNHGSASLPCTHSGRPPSCRARRCPPIPRPLSLHPPPDRQLIPHWPNSVSLHLSASEPLPTRTHRRAEVGLGSSASWDTSWPPPSLISRSAAASVGAILGPGPVACGCVGRPTRSPTNAVIRALGRSLSVSPLQNMA